MFYDNKTYRGDRSSIWYFVSSMECIIVCGKQTFILRKIINYQVSIIN